MTPDRIAWYRQQADYFGEWTRLRLREASDLQLEFCADELVGEARLAAHFGRLALEDHDDLELCRDGNFTKVTISGHGAFLPEAQLNAATERIAALEGALEEALTVASTAITMEFVTDRHRANFRPIVARLRAVLGKDG